MLTKNWEIELIDYVNYDDEGMMTKIEAWQISDGITNHIFPVKRYPTKASAWKAWENKIM